MVAIILIGLAFGWHALVWLLTRKVIPEIDRPSLREVVAMVERDLLREVERRTRNRRKFAREWAEAKRRLG